MNHHSLHDRAMRAGARAFGFLVERGVRLGPMMILTVQGRRTGLPRRNPVDVFEQNGHRWLVSTHGVGNANWVQNLRAAGRGTLTRGRACIEFAASELDDDAALDVLTDVIGPRVSRPLAGAVLRRTLGVPRHATRDDFARVARQHPVFELTP